MPGADSGGVLGSMDPLRLHGYIEQYVYYPAVVHLSAFTVRSIILFTNAAILRINPLPPNAISLVPRLLCNCRSTWLRSDAEATLSYLHGRQEVAVR